jgi:hypothetical protein
MEVIGKVRCGQLCAAAEPREEVDGRRTAERDWFPAAGSANSCFSLRTDSNSDYNDAFYNRQV